MTDRFRTVPATERYAGLTELLRDGRTFAMLGTGPEIEDKLRKLAD